MGARVLVGDCREILRSLPAESVQCVVTSPPYWGLRDYGVEGQIGLEPTPAAFIAELVAVFREVRRVLRSDGTCWVNMGDSYAQGHGGSSTEGRGITIRKANRGAASPADRADVDVMGWSTRDATPRNVVPGIKPKDLVGQPWRLAFALQDDGWWLRSDIIWSKPNPMPESVTDRPTKAHEYVFLLTKSPRYFYDADAIREPGVEPDRQRADRIGGANGHKVRHSPGAMIGASANRNARTVWTIATEAFAEAHFATFPTELARRCILAGSRPGDTILDPFGGAGTTALVADRLQRDSISIELNPAYAEMAKRRISSDAGMFAEVSDA